MKYRIQKLGDKYRAQYSYLGLRWKHVKTEWHVSLADIWYTPIYYKSYDEASWAVREHWQNRIKIISTPKKNVWENVP